MTVKLVSKNQLPQWKYKVMKRYQETEKKLLKRKNLLIPQDISPQELAQALKVPKEQIKWVCEERADITPDLAARLALCFDTSVELWLNLQRSYEEEVAERQTQLLKKEIIPRKVKQKKPILHASIR